MHTSAHLFVLMNEFNFARKSCCYFKIFFIKQKQKFYMGHSSNINLFTYIGNYSYKQARKREELVELTISFKEKKKIQVS